MKITDIRIQLIKQPKSKLLAFAEITLDDQLVVKDFQIFSSDRGLFVGMPSKKLSDGTWKELIFPIETELAERIKTSVLRAYEDEVQRPEVRFGN